MKKIISFLLVLVMVLAAVGCSSDAEVAENTASESTYASDTTSSGSVSHPGKPSAGSGKSGAASPTESSPAGGGSGTIVKADRPTDDISYATRTETASSAAEINFDDFDPSALEESAAGYDGSELYDMIESKSLAREGVAGIAIAGEGGSDGFVGSSAFGDYDEYGDYGEYGDYDFIDRDDDSEIWITDPVEPKIIDDPYEPSYQISAGLLTAGEWNDNKNFWFIQNLLANGQSYNYSDFFKKWGLSPFTRLVVRCTAAGAPAQGATVEVTSASNGAIDNTSNGAIFSGVTDHEGMCYVYYSAIDQAAAPTQVTVKYGSDIQVIDITPTQLSGEENIEVSFETEESKTKKLDLMFTIDTTGSMSDEIRYLQKELENVIIRVKNDCGNIPVRLSVNFYRDHGDAYVVRPYEFTTDIDSALANLAREYADGGGDYEEAVELALDSSINDHAWDDDSIKLMFMVLDAPPHNTASIRESLHESIMAASKKGIRIIPVASSGVDKDTEFLLRAFAMTTGGTYTFLTDDSGIGGSHLEPTVGDYEVEHLNDMLVRIIEEYIG
ncbi:MAG: VWA domain-containing protein [Lachnospiraceae bacterium]|nr:VWA domain-containing protein [Lachnospiraceae bacterium]